MQFEAPLADSQLKRPSKEWALKQPYGIKSVIAAILIATLLVFSGKHTEIDRMFYLLGEAAGKIVGLNEESQVVKGTVSVATKMWPPQISEKREISRIENFDPDNLPMFSKIETRVVEVTSFDPNTLKASTVESTEQVLVKRFGYLIFTFFKMLETVEIAIWATLFSIIFSIPLAFCSAANYSPHPVIYNVARAIVSFFRAIPELISAMFLVLAFGFGPIAGILALSLHSAGFLGKFYAEDIENADVGPQEALRAVGVSKFKTLRFAVLPQVLPQYVAYTIYILDRNIRMATVIGIVGAGGIGQELKGRYDLFDYSHVTTILLLIFATVFLLDRVAGMIRARLLS